MDWYHRSWSSPKDISPESRGSWPSPACFRFSSCRFRASLMETSGQTPRPIRMRFPQRNTLDSHRLLPLGSTMMKRPLPSASRRDRSFPSSPRSGLRASMSEFVSRSLPRFSARRGRPRPFFCALLPESALFFASIGHPTSSAPVRRPERRPVRNQNRGPFLPRFGEKDNKTRGLVLCRTQETAGLKCAGGKGGIRTHVPHLWDNSISSRARCDRFDTFPLRRRPDQPARQAFGPSYEKTHISLCASFLEIYGVSKQIRTALSDVRGRCPNRIDDGDVPHV